MNTVTPFGAITVFPEIFVKNNLIYFAIRFWKRLIGQFIKAI